MRKPSVKFIEIAREIERITSMREQIVLNAFAILENQHAALAQTLVDNVASRQRAAYWMCTHQRAFDGRNAYEVLADGDEDQVWDRISGNPVGESLTHFGQSRMAY